MSNDIHTDDCDNDNDELQIWTDSRGRTQVKGGGGDIVSLSKLTAVARHGIEAVKQHDHVHHGLQAGSDQPVRVDTPQWLYTLDSGEHMRLHVSATYASEDGIPILSPTEERDETLREKSGMT
jgi:hypothetical protein